MVATKPMRGGGDFCVHCGHSQLDSDGEYIRKLEARIKELEAWKENTSEAVELVISDYDKHGIFGLVQRAILMQAIAPPSDKEDI